MREVLRDLGLEEWVRRPTLCIGDNRNARDWANEKVISEGNQHLDRHYFTIRERVRSGEILPIWIEGKNNPADVLTKAIDKAVTDELGPYLCGEEEIPLPDGVRVWFGPPNKPVLRGNKSGRKFGVIIPPNQDVAKAQRNMAESAAAHSPPDFDTWNPLVDPQQPITALEPEPEMATTPVQTDTVPLAGKAARLKQIVEKTGLKPSGTQPVPKHRKAQLALPRRSRRVAGHAPTPLSAGMRKMGNTMVPGLHPTRRETKQWMDDHKRYWDTITAAIDRDYNERGIRQWRYWGMPTPDGW